MDRVVFQQTFLEHSPYTCRGFSAPKLQEDSAASRMSKVTEKLLVRFILAFTPEQKNSVVGVAADGMDAVLDFAKECKRQKRRLPAHSCGRRDFQQEGDRFWAVLSRCNATESNVSDIARLVKAVASLVKDHQWPMGKCTTGVGSWLQQIVWGQAYQQLRDEDWERFVVNITKIDRNNTTAKELVNLCPLIKAVKNSVSLTEAAANINPLCQALGVAVAHGADQELILVLLQDALWPKMMVAQDREIVSAAFIVAAVFGAMERPEGLCLPLATQVARRVQMEIAVHGQLLRKEVADHLWPLAPQLVPDTPWNAVAQKKFINGLAEWEQTLY